MRSLVYATVDLHTMPCRHLGQGLRQHVRTVLQWRRVQRRHRRMRLFKAVPRVPLRDIVRSALRVHRTIALHLLPQHG